MAKWEEQAIRVAGEQVAGYQGRRPSGDKSIGAEFVSREAYLGPRGSKFEAQNLHPPK